LSRYAYRKASWLVPAIYANAVGAEEKNIASRMWG
jgi:hypothetical protein